MARASYLTRRDGRYWVQCRFDPFRDPADPIRHVRFALRTADYAVAVRRMLKAMSIITEFKVHADQRAAAVDLFDRTIRALSVPGPYSEDQRVAWEALERAGNRIIGAANALHHPIGVHSPEFWPTWKRFVERNAWIDAQSRRGDRVAHSVGTSVRGQVETDMPADVKEKLGLADRRVVGPDLFPVLRSRPVLDNQTMIASLRTEWGEEEAHITYVGDAAPRPVAEQDLHGVEDARGEADPPAADDLAHHDRLAETIREQFDLMTRKLGEGVQTPGAASNAPAPSDLVHHDTLAESIKDRLDTLAKKLGDRRADESHGRVLQFALDFLTDLPLTTITARDLRRLETALTEIPDRKGIPRQQAKSLYMRYRYAKEFGTEGLVFIGETTLKNTYYGCMNAFLGWARTKTDWTPPDFFFDAESDDAPEAQQRDAFTEEELLRFFSLPLFTGCKSTAHIWQPGEYFVQNELYWGYVIHILMGLRPSEIGKLKVEDIVREGDLWFIDLRRKAIKPDEGANAKKRRRLKTQSSYRRVPIPRLLIDLGLIDRKEALEKAGEIKLFPEWHVYRHPQSGRDMFGHHLSKSWQYVKVEHGFERDFLTLYSGRHTVAGWYDALKMPQRIRDRLLGHKSQGVQGRYGPIDLTMAEARTAMSSELQIQLDIADRLLTAKLRAEFGMLKAAPILAMAKMKKELTPVSDRANSGARRN